MAGIPGINSIPIDPQDYAARLEQCSDLELATWLNFVGSPVCREAAKRLERAAVLKAVTA
jgi:hypothetical protein